MRASSQLALVLLGGGALASGVAVSAESWRACNYDRLHDVPSAESRCHGTSGGGYFGGGGRSWWGGLRGASAADGATGWHTVSRGGFGFFGMHFGGFHG